MLYYVKGVKMNWLDIVVIALIALFAIIGLFKGFFDGLISICTIFVSLIISITLANPFANLIRSIVDIDGWWDFILQKLGVGDSMVIFGALYAREKLAAFLTVLVSTIILFIFIRCLVRLLKKLFQSISKKSKIINNLNKFFGFVLGAMKGSIIIILILAVCSIITSLGVPGLSDTITTTIDGTTVTSFAYEKVDSIIDQKFTGKTFEEIIKGLFDEQVAQEQEENSTLYVAYPDNKDYYEFNLNEEIDYSKIIVMYKTGSNTTNIVDNLGPSNFSQPIDTSQITLQVKTTNINAYGKTVEFRYVVI